MEASDPWFGKGMNPACLLLGLNYAWHHEKDISKICLCIEAFVI